MASKDDKELIEYVNILREGSLRDILVLCKDSKMATAMKCCHNTLRFDNEVLSKAVGLIGDTASALGSQILKFSLASPLFI